MILPKVPKGFVTNFPNAVPDFVGPRQLIFLLSVVIVLILTSFFFITSQNLSQKGQDPQYISFLNQMRQDAQTLQFPSSLWEKRFSENLDAAAKGSDSQKQFEALSANFNILSGMYSTSHDSKVRIQTESLSRFISNEFPDQSKNHFFSVPCLDLGCGQPNYSEEVLKIKEEIQGIKSIDPLVLESISKKFDAAAFSADPNVQWQNYLDVFQALKSEIARTNGSQIVEVTVKLKEFLKEQYPVIVDQWEKDLPDLLTI